MDEFTSMPVSSPIDVSPAGIQREVERYLERIAAITQEIEARRVLNKRGDLADEDFRPWMRRAMAARSEYRGQVASLRNALDAQRHTERKANRGPARLPKGHVFPEMKAPPPQWREPESRLEAVARKKELVRLLFEHQDAVRRGERRNGDAYRSWQLELHWLKVWFKANDTEKDGAGDSPRWLIENLLNIIDRLTDDGVELTEEEHALTDRAAGHLEWVAAERARILAERDALRAGGAL